MRSASCRLTIPSGSLSGPERRTSGAMISRFRRCLRSSRWRRSRNSVAMVSILLKRCYPKDSEAAAVRTAKSVIRWKSAFVPDVFGDTFRERCQRHHTEVHVAPGAHCDGTCRLLLLAHDEDERQLLHRMLPYFI